MAQPRRLDTMGVAVDALANSTPSGKVLFGSMNMVSTVMHLNPCVPVVAAGVNPSLSLLRKLLMTVLTHLISAAAFLVSASH
jgi:hypothetical protein